MKKTIIFLLLVGIFSIPNTTDSGRKTQFNIFSKNIKNESDFVIVDFKVDFETLGGVRYIAQFGTGNEQTLVVKLINPPNRYLTGETVVLLLFGRNPKTDKYMYALII